MEEIENDNKELFISKNTEKSKSIPENLSKMSINPSNCLNSEILYICLEKTSEKLKSHREHAEMEILNKSVDEPCETCKGKKQLH